MKTYAERKDAARNEAIEWDLNADKENLSYGDLVIFADYFEKLGRRYGLLKEFKENGII